MRASVHDDIALPPLALTHVVEHRDAAGRLHDASEAYAIGDRAERAELGQPDHQAAHCERGVLRTVVAIVVGGVVARWRIRVARRGIGIVFAAAAWRLLVPARFG